MTQRIVIHPDNPQLRLIRQVADCIREGNVVVYPTDSAYALGCQLGNKEAMERIRHLRQLDKTHNFTLVCRDLSEIATYANVDNRAFRLIKANTPGAYTFILPATAEVPKRLQHPKRKTIGIRVPKNAITQALLTELNEPLMSVTLILPGDEFPLNDPEVIYDRLHHQVDMIVDGGFCDLEPTSVIDMTTDTPEIIRRGKGDVSPF